MRFRLRRKSVVGAERSAEWYDGAYAGSKVYRAPYQCTPYYFLWTVIADRLRRDGLKCVLDIGCGPGQLAAFLFTQGVERYVGVDFSPKAIEYARVAAPTGRFLIDDALTTNIYTDEPHDALICTEVLEHITDDLGVVARFVPGTRCLLSVPSYNSAGHVRFFANADQVWERYAEHFDTLEVARFPLAAVGDHAIFLADGITR